MQSPQVLIVGSGPAGLVLAISLLKNGIPVRIIAKDAQHHIGERGRVIMPRVMEIYHFLGVFEDIKSAGSRWPYIQFFDPEDPYHVKSSEIMLEEVEPTPAFPITKGVMLGQWQHQSILRSHVEALEGDIELGTTLVGIEQTESGATALISKSINGEEVVQKDSFRYIIGADGARSTVRKSLNVDFIGETQE
ncbi:hypothetical protein M0805_003001 [Coniferiporia weirii]|nr:hypothetical protein M0805_003001 [Coniferiporia weirii]